MRSAVRSLSSALGKVLGADVQALPITRVRRLAFPVVLRFCPPPVVFLLAMRYALPRKHASSFDVCPMPAIDTTLTAAHFDLDSDCAADLLLGLGASTYPPIVRLPSRVAR